MEARKGYPDYAHLPLGAHERPKITGNVQLSSRLARRCYNPIMTTVLRARFDGKVLVPEGIVDLPVGEVMIFRLHAEVRPIAAEEITGAQRLAEKLAAYPPAELPRDFSAQHDHYVYGSPKRDDA